MLTKEINIDSLAVDQFKQNLLDADPRTEMIVLETNGNHPEFETISRHFMENWGGPPLPYGRAPIDNMEAYLERRRHDVASKRGIKTQQTGSLLRHLEIVSECYSFWNIGEATTIPLPEQHLTAVLVCVGYSEQLAYTLPHNKKLCDQIVVVTTTDDIETQRIVKLNGCTLALSDSCYEGNASFNKGRMLNAGCRFVRGSDWVVFTDADVFLDWRLRSLIKDTVMNPGCFYYTNRLDLKRHDVPKYLARDKFFRFAPPSGKNDEPSGYFQLWNRNASAIRQKWPNVCSERFPSAGGVDCHFFQQWDVKTKMIGLPECPVIHIEHSQSWGQQWNGISKPIDVTKWRQLGNIVPKRGIYFFTSESETQVAGAHVKLIRLRNGDEADFIMPEERIIPQDIFHADEDGNCIFKGKDCGLEYFYIAYRRDETPV